MILVYIIIGVVALAILAMTVASHHRSFKMTSQTTGTVVSSSEREVTTEAGRSFQTEITCRYRAGGADRELTHTFRGKLASRFPAGKSVPVKYDPAEPHVATLAVRA